MPRARHKRRRHYRLAHGAACDTWHGSSSRTGFERAPLRMTRDPDRVTCLRCLSALEQANPPTPADSVSAVEYLNGSRDRALPHAHSSFQRGILEGRDSLSASTRPGFWRAVYRDQVTTLLERFTRAGIPWRIEARGRAHRLVLVIGGTK